MIYDYFYDCIVIAFRYFVADPTLVVAALIVMEFLIADQEVTEEISSSVGVIKPTGKDQLANVHDFGENEV